MREEGVVVESRGDRARIRVERSSACKNCSAKVLCRPFGETHNVMEVANPEGAAKGQHVVVAVEPARLVKSSLLVYGIPIAALIAGAAVGSQIARAAPGDEAADVGAIAGAAVFLGLAVILMRALDRIAGRKVESLPRIVEVVREHEAGVGGVGAY